jgi:hypothetical protein
MNRWLNPLERIKSSNLMDWGCKYESGVAHVLLLQTGRWSNLVSAGTDLKANCVGALRRSCRGKVGCWIAHKRKQVNVGSCQGWPEGPGAMFPEIPWERRSRRSSRSPGKPDAGRRVAANLERLTERGAHW